MWSYVNAIDVASGPNALRKNGIQWIQTRPSTHFPGPRAGRLEATSPGAPRTAALQRWSQHPGTRALASLPSPAARSNWRQENVAPGSHQNVRRATSQ